MVAGSLLDFCSVAPAKAGSLAPLAFAKLYVTQIAETDRLRQKGQQNNIAGKPDFAACVHNMAALQLEFSAQASVMRGVKLTGAAKDYPSQLADLWELKSKLYGDFASACEHFMAAPKPGVDYGEIAAKLPRIRASLEAADRTALEASPLVFAVLIDERVDRKGHASHLVITNHERADLVRTIDSRFAAEMNSKETPALVSSVGVLRDYLLKKGFKGSDDPW